MFENTAHFDFDEDAVLSTSFTPTSSSTQTYKFSNKRTSEEFDKENAKKLKPAASDQGKHLTFCSPNEKNRFSDVSFSSPNRIVKRKFPGPAGLLPDRTENNKSISDLIANEIHNDEDNADLLLCSQQAVSVFEDGPWKEMTKDFNVPNGERLYQKFNIKWIKKEAALKKLLVNHKAPFLAAIIHSVEIVGGKSPTVNVMLKDATGDIQGTILHSLYEEYATFFTVGSVLVLKQFGVLSAGYKHCLTITPNNLLTIYCLELPQKLPNEDVFTQNRNLGTVKRVLIQKCSVQDILNKYEEDVAVSVLQGIHFERLKQNVGNFKPGNCSTERYQPFVGNKFVLPQSTNSVRQQSAVDMLKFNNDLNRTSSAGGTCTSANVSQEQTSGTGNVKKQFNFKPQTNFQASKVATKENCDIINCSQVSVKADTKEHTEIWKNLLQGVDTDSLFDDF